jgi:hypothetical protein
MSRLAHRAVFQWGGASRTGWEALVESERWQVRLNEHPTAEHRYSLLVDGVVAEEFDDWPACWTRPSVPPTGAPAAAAPEDDPYERREYEVELERFERSQNIPPLKIVPSLDTQRAEAAEREERACAQDRGPCKRVRRVDALFAALEAQNAHDLAKAERWATAGGKEPFVLDRLAELLQEAPDSLTERERPLRSKYYLLYPQIRTLAEYAELIRELDVWS